MVRATRYIEIIEEDRLLENATTVGAYLQAGLRKLGERHSMVTNVRGAGLMCAFDLPTPELRRSAIDHAMQDEYMIVLPSGPRSIRFRPTLDLRRDDVDEAMTRLDRVLGKLA
jgi:L-lysine 6-transaminase